MVDMNKNLRLQNVPHNRHSSISNIFWPGNVNAEIIKLIENEYIFTFIFIYANRSILAFILIHSKNSIFLVFVYIRHHCDTRIKITTFCKYIITPINSRHILIETTYFKNTSAVVALIRYTGAYTDSHYD